MYFSCPHTWSTWFKLEKTMVWHSLTVPHMHIYPPNHIAIVHVHVDWHYFCCWWILGRMYMSVPLICCICLLGFCNSCVNLRTNWVVLLSVKAVLLVNVELFSLRCPLIVVFVCVAASLCKVQCCFACCATYIGWLHKKDNPFGLNRTLVVICINFWSHNKCLVLSCRLSDNLSLF